MFAAKNELLTRPSGGYQISRSLRFRSSASAYLNRTFGTPTNRNIWTWSGWVKRGTLGTQQGLQAAGNGSTDASGIVIETTGQVSFYDYVSSAFPNKITTIQVLRDPSAWYHIVVNYDTTQAASSNRSKIFINAVQSSVTGTNPSLNYSGGYFNSNTYASAIGREDGFGNYLDGYLAEVNFIDGQALDPTSFGAYDTTTGVWGPKKYTGTYGTNGFYLNFSDNSGATSTTIGKDSSGNSNNWTPNNISVTSGTTYDSMIDTPTPYADGGNGRGNYATLNPINVNVGGSPTVEYANLRLTTAASGVARYSTIGMTSGKWYAEFVATGGAPRFGVSDASETGADLTASLTISKGSSTGELDINGTINGTAASFSATSLVSVAYDADTRKVWIAVNGTWQNYSGSGADPASGTNPIGVLAGSNAAYFGVRSYNCSVDCNFGQRPFTYTPPSGYSALNTQNLPTPTIKNGAQYMDATLYNGQGSSTSVTNAAGFAPDFVWIKSRSGTWSHSLFDKLRGVQNALFTNATNAESTRQLTAFNANGFTYAGTDADTGTSGYTYVAWQWKAGGTASTIAVNAYGSTPSIASSVSANTSAGFSIVTYTGTGANATVGHGLGVAPSMVIVKQRTASSATSWYVYHSSIGATYSVYLNSTLAQDGPNAVFWNNTAPTSNVFSIGTSTGVSANTGTFVAYCFANVSGYSSAFSYTGNGSSDGPMVFLNFRPRWILAKRTDTTGDWWIIDTSRDTYNVSQNGLNPNLSNAESTGWYVDVLSNGFKIRVAGTGTSMNASGGTYIGYAIAENPFKFSLAR